MRLAYLTSQYPATSHTFIRREVLALRKLGVSIDTFSIRAPSAEELASEDDRNSAATTFTVLDQPVSAFLAAHLASLLGSPLAYLKILLLALGHRPPGLRGLLLSLAHFAESILLARELKRRDIWHLHNHFANSAATVGLLATRMLGIGWSFTIHGTSETDFPAGLLLPAKIIASDMVVCVSWFGRAQGMRLVEPDQWRKFHVVRCGLPLVEIPKRAESGGAPTAIVAVGRLSAEKGQAGLLEAFAKVHAEYADVRLRLIGSGPERGLLERRASELGIASVVEFAGRLSEADTLDEIARADLLVLSSFMEGLPIVLMEAMAIGVPVVASRVAGIPELVEDGVTGLLFTPANWDELAVRMNQLLADPAMRDRLTGEAKKKIEAEFDADKSARQLAVLFERLQEQDQ